VAVLPVAVSGSFTPDAAFASATSGDTTPPSVSVTSPAAGATIAGTVALSASASDNVGVTQVKWYVDGREVAWDGDGAPWTKSWNSTSVADGSHQVFAKAADAAANWGSSAALTFTVRNATQAADVTVTVDRTVPAGSSSLAVGVTHTQYSLDPGGDPAAVDSGKTLLAAATRYQNQQIYGWGAGNPNPRPGVYDWSSLDRRIALIRSMGATPVITLCCAPDWMTSVGTTTSNFPALPPTSAHYGDFAELARQIALRYRDVKNYLVWNEMKGFWNSSTDNWDYQAYTSMYNQVYDALKAVDPSIKVGGPYLVLEGTGSNVGDWSTQAPISARNLQVIDYWLRYKHGADFIVVTRRVLDWHDRTSYSEKDLLALSYLFASTSAQIRARTSLPIWWSEDYCAGGGRPDYFAGNNDWSFQAVCLASVLYHELKGGSSVTLRWQPQGIQGSVYYGNDENLFSDTRQAGGGQPFPSYWVYRDFDDLFPPGTPLYQATSSSPDIEVVASSTRTLIINKRPVSTTVDVNGSRITLGRYEVRVV
jgi:Bacterial Ig domain/Glycosyl hydrolases family 39